LAVPLGAGPPESDPRRSFAPKVRRLAKTADALGRWLGAVAEAPCDGVAERESVRWNTARSSGRGVRPFDQPLCQVIQGELRCLHSPMARAAPDRTFPGALDPHARVAVRHCGTGRLRGSSGVHAHLPSDRGRQSGSMEAGLPSLILITPIRW